MDYENPWMYKGEVFTSEHINDTHGFIYLIKEKSTGRMYIGQKHFWTKKVKTVNKKKKKVKVESDWKKYYSSSNYINEKVAAEGVEDFERYILMMVQSDGYLNYYEMKLQVDLRVLEFPEKYINGYIGGRISSMHIKKQFEIDQDLDMLNTLYENTYFGFLNENK